MNPVKIPTLSDLEALAVQLLWKSSAWVLGGRCCLLHIVCTYILSYISDDALCLERFAALQEVSQLIEQRMPSRWPGGTVKWIFADV